MRDDSCLDCARTTAGACEKHSALKVKNEVFEKLSHLVERLSRDNTQFKAEITRLNALLESDRLYKILDKFCNECSCLGCNQAERLNLSIKEIRGE